MKSGWQVKELGAVCDFQRGLTYAKGDEAESSENVVLRATNINLETNQLDLSELKYINDGIVVPTNKKVRKGSLLICTASGSKSHLGKVAYIDNEYDYAFGGFMGMITVKNGLCPRYLFHLMTSPLYKDFIEGLSDGVNINNLKFDDLRNFQVPYPPPEEQQRIIRILDEAFEAIATAKANAEKNLQNARALFESHLNSVFSHLASTNESRQLGDISDLLGGFAFRSGDSVQQSSTQLVRIGNLYRNALDLGRSPVFYPDSFAFDFERYLLREGDLIMSLTGTTGKKDYGFTVKIPECSNKLLLNQRIVKFELPSKGPVNKDYLFYYLRSKVFLDMLYATANGTRQANLSTVQMKTLRVPLCRLTEQQEIVKTLDALNEEAQTLESVYRLKLATLEEFKKTFLHQAFTGQL